MIMSAESVPNPKKTRAPGSSPGKKGVDTGVRLQKWLSEAGLCSRREGERWILAGRLAINDEVVTQLGSKVMAGDRVALDAKEINRPPLERLVLAMYKPIGVICTRHDPEGRTTMYDILGPDMPRLNAVGRLDYNSEGLILLTNDGLLAHRLTHPSHEVERVYRVRLHGYVDADILAKLRRGTQLEDGPTGPLSITLDRHTQSHHWLTIILREGRNRMVRRIFESQGLTVARLIRVGYGGIQLGNQEPGSWRPLSPDEVVQLRRAAGFHRVRR